MSDIEALDAVALQTGIRVNERTHRGKLGWSISPNIERASAPRERGKPAAVQQKAVAAVAVGQPARRLTAVAKIIADYPELVEAFRERLDEMGMTRQELDHQAGLPDRYAGKILGRGRVRALGLRSLGPVLGALGFRLLLIDDTAQTAKIMARRQPRERPVRQTPACAVSAASIAGD
ncbi:hypothetical protein [Bradyrhizobium erythrophlei]|nr:hypothetical protein [Bradyrhizobium erythrophlei]